MGLQTTRELESPYNMNHEILQEPMKDNALIVVISAVW